MKPFLALALAALFSSADAQSVDYTSGMLQTINDVRTQRNLNTICINHKVVTAAQKYAEEMAAYNHVSVNGVNGSSPSGRLAAQNFKVYTTAELVGAGHQTAGEMLQVWMQTSPDYFYQNHSFIGVGYQYNATQQYKTYWVLDLARGIDEICDA